MDIYEASRNYNIPMEILRAYERWGLCSSVKKVMGAWQYDDQDLERLSVIVTLHDIGFTAEEVETYMRLKMLNQKREQTLDQIHFKERQMAYLDYLRYQIQKNQKEL